MEELIKNRHEFLDLMQQKNIKALGDLAHKLHGACCFCGVPLLQKTVIQVEKMAARASHIEELKAVFAELIQNIDAVINEYENQYQKS